MEQKSYIKIVNEMNLNLNSCFDVIHEYFNEENKTKEERKEMVYEKSFNFYKSSFLLLNQLKADSSPELLPNVKKLEEIIAKVGTILESFDNFFK